MKSLRVKYISCNVGELGGHYSLELLIIIVQVKDAINRHITLPTLRVLVILECRAIIVNNCVSNVGYINDHNSAGLRSEQLNATYAQMLPHPTTSLPSSQPAH